MIRKKDLIIIGVVSLALAVLGFILDLNERVPDIRVNIFETLMMAGILYVVISTVYFPVKLLKGLIDKRKSRQGIV